MATILIGHDNACKKRGKIYLHRDAIDTESHLTVASSAPDSRSLCETYFLDAAAMVLRNMKVQEDTPPALPQRTGTPSFMAVDLLRPTNVFPHWYRHDLESFFY